MARNYDVESVLGLDFEFELTPEVLAYELSMDFSNQIIKRCAETGLGLGELASLMGIGASTLSEKLNGQNLTLKSMASMAIALGCDIKAPELIVEPEVACATSGSWSLPFAKVSSEPPSDLSKEWPELESAHLTESTFIADAKSPQSYQYTAIFGKAA